jgi:translation initiation factor IF-1
MPINTKGGKSFKKKKGGQGPEVIIERKPGEIPARVLKLLGNRMAYCYSNDNILLRCHICGRMKGRDFVEVGDIVLITTRDYESKNIEVEGREKKERTGDIIAKYPSDQLSSLRKEAGVNMRIFLKLEVTDNCKLQHIGDDLTKTEMVVNDLEDLFDSTEDEYDVEDKERREKERKKKQNAVVSEEAINEIVKPEEEEAEEEEVKLDDL